MRNPDYPNTARRLELGTLVCVVADQWNRDRRPTTIVGINHLNQYITQRKEGAPYKVFPANMIEFYVGPEPMRRKIIPWSKRATG